MLYPFKKNRLLYSLHTHTLTHTHTQTGTQATFLLIIVTVFFYKKKKNLPLYSTRNFHKIGHTKPHRSKPTVFPHATRLFLMPPIVLPQGQVQKFSESLGKWLVVVMRDMIPAFSFFLSSVITSTGICGKPCSCVANINPN